MVWSEGFPENTRVYDTHAVLHSFIDEDMGPGGWQLQGFPVLSSLPPLCRPVALAFPSARALQHFLVTFCLLNEPQETAGPSSS